MPRSQNLGSKVSEKYISRYHKIYEYALKNTEGYLFADKVLFSIAINGLKKSKK